MVLLATTTTSVLGQVRPPNFSPDAIPDTSFSCEDKITGGYYADLEADCQLFHVCVQVSEFEVRKYSSFILLRKCLLTKYWGLVYFIIILKQLLCQ